MREQNTEVRLSFRRELPLRGFLQPFRNPRRLAGRRRRRMLHRAHRRASDSQLGRLGANWHYRVLRPLLTEFVAPLPVVLRIIPLRGNRARDFRRLIFKSITFFSS